MTPPLRLPVQSARPHVTGHGLQELHDLAFGDLLWPAADTVLHLLSQVAAFEARDDAGEAQVVLAAHVLARLEHAWSRAWPGSSSFPDPAAAWGRANQEHWRECRCGTAGCDVRLSDRMQSLIGRLEELVVSSPAWFDGDAAAARRYVLAVTGVAVTVVVRTRDAADSHVPQAVAQAAVGWYCTYLP